MLAPVIVRILAGAIRRFRHVGAAPKDAPSVHVNEGRYLRACPRPGDGPSQLRKRPPARQMDRPRGLSRGRQALWRGLATTRPTSQAKSRPRRAEPPGSRQPLAPRVDTRTGNQTNLAGGDHQLAHDDPTSRSHPTMGTCVVARHAHPRASWRGCPGLRAAHRPREPARACAPTTPRTMKGASIVKVECESGLSPPPHPIPSCPWPTPQPTKDTPPRSTKPRGGSQVDQRVIDTYAVQALAAVPLRARMR
jgi:hypothetical protein